MIRRLGAIVAAVWLVAMVPLSAQDSTAPYPWRLSWFPYLTASPNDGVMAMARAILFRPSRWEDRVSLQSGISVEGGYSTKDAWLVRAQGDFPHLAEGWRLQAHAEARHSAEFLVERDPMVPGSRQSFSAEVSRVLGGPFLVSFRGEAAHLGINARRETDVQGRIALILDARDREYDTRRGVLVQGGMIVGTGQHRLLGANLDGSALVSPGANYTGWYALASGWHSLGDATRLTTRVGGRWMSSGADQNIDPLRTMPGWEDAFAVLGGPESNRALPIAARTDRKLILASVEIRHDIITFPGGAIAALAFVDGGRSFCDCDVTTLVSLVSPSSLRPSMAMSAASPPREEWLIGPGAGVAVRLLRNAIVTLTAARGEGRTRWYLSSGWAW